MIKKIRSLEFILLIILIQFLVIMNFGYAEYSPSGYGTVNQPSLVDYYQAIVPENTVITAAKHPPTKSDITKWEDPIWDDLGWSIAKDSAAFGSQIHIPGAYSGFNGMLFYLNVLEKNKDKLKEFEDKYGITDFWLSVLPHEPLEPASVSSSSSSKLAQAKIETPVVSLPTSGISSDASSYGSINSVVEKSIESVPTNKPPVTQPVDPQPTAAADAFSVGTQQSNVRWLETSPTDISQSNSQTKSQSSQKKFAKGDRIEVTDSLNVRDSPGLSSGTVTSTKAAGSTATVLSGPYFKDDFTWWEVQYDDGTTGYSQEKRLELVQTSASNQPPASSRSKYELESNLREPAQTATQSTNAKFSKGDRIEVTDSLNVRDAPGLSSGTVISTKSAGNTATVLSGPYYRDDFTWWEVRYEDGTTGYSQEKRLELAQTSASSQTPAVQPVDPPTVTEPIDQPDDFAFGDNQQIEDSAYVNQIPSSNSESIHRDSSGGPLTGQVQLELSLRNENGNPAPAGTKVLIEDGSGNYVKANLDSNGYALVYGDPGTWTITADAPGYATNTGYTSVSSESSHSSFRMNLQEGGTNDQAPSVNSPISPQSSAFPADQPASSAATKVSLEIDLRNENGNAVPAGTKVAVRDGSGNIVPTNWDSNGHTIAYGDPGTWTITAEAPGYATNMYYAAVSSSSSSTSTRIYLQKNGYIDQPPQQSSPTINPASQSANQQSSQQSTNGQSVSQTQDEKLSKTQKDAILIDLLESRTKGKDLSADEVDALMNDLDELGRQLDQQSGESPADNGPAFGDNADDGTAFGDNADDGTAFGDNLHEGTAFGM